MNIFEILILAVILGTCLGYIVWRIRNAFKRPCRDCPYASSCGTNDDDCKT